MTGIALILLKRARHYVEKRCGIVPATKDATATAAAPGDRIIPTRPDMADNISLTASEIDPPPSKYGAVKDKPAKSDTDNTQTKTISEADE